MAVFFHGEKRLNCLFHNAETLKPTIVGTVLNGKAPHNNCSTKNKGRKLRPNCMKDFPWGSSLDGKTLKIPPY